MLYPKGEAVHRNLSAEYTDVSDLLSVLKSNDFAGIVEVEGADKKGAFFVGYGKTLNALVEGKANSMAVVGEQAVAELLGLSAQPNTALNVYRLTAKEVELVASTLESEILFKGLTTDFVRLDRFIKKLSDERHNGYIEVFAKNDKPMGILFLKDGQLMNLSITHESGSPALSGQEAIPAFLQSVMKQGAMFNAYRSIYSSLPKEEDTNAQEEPQVTSPKETTDEVEEENVPKELRIVLCAQEADGSENGRNEFVLGLEAVFSSIEKVVDGFSEKGGFQRAFKKALLKSRICIRFSILSEINSIIMMGRCSSTLMCGRNNLPWELQIVYVWPCPTSSRNSPRTRFCPRD